MGVAVYSWRAACVTLTCTMNEFKSVSFENQIFFLSSLYFMDIIWMHSLKAQARIHPL